MGNNNKILIAVLILANVVIWPLVIVPGIVGILQTRPKTAEPIQPETAGPGKPSDPSPSKIDLLNLRNPFFLRDDHSQRPVVTHRNNGTSSSRPSVPAEKFVSKFRLKSIVQANNKFIASLEEIPHYGTEQNRNTSYTYRFGSDPDTVESASYVVSEGDELLGEKVVRIGENFLVLSKAGKYYKLTFSGGSSVQQP